MNDMDHLWVNIIKPAFIAALARLCAVISPAENVLRLFFAASGFNFLEIIRTA